MIACLDVRANDKGDLVVTKGDQYDVREKSTAGRDVRNLGLPVELAGRYFSEGADEVSFLNITGFRDFPLGDMPMLQVRSSLDVLCNSFLLVGTMSRQVMLSSGGFPDCCQNREYMAYCVPTTDLLHLACLQMATASGHPRQLPDIGTAISAQLQTVDTRPD